MRYNIHESTNFLMKSLIKFYKLNAPQKPHSWHKQHSGPYKHLSWLLTSRTSSVWKTNKQTNLEVPDADLSPGWIYSFFFLWKGHSSFCYQHSIKDLGWVPSSDKITIPKALPPKVASLVSSSLLFFQA